MNWILLSGTFAKVKKRKELIIKKIIAKQFTSLIKVYYKVYFNRQIELHYKEILPLFKDYKESLSYSLEVLKNIAIVLGFSYVKGYSPNFYYKVTKYIYTIKTGDTLESFNYENARCLLINIIDNKQWDKLLDTNTHKAIIYIYQVNEDKTNYFNVIITNINYKICRIISVWTFTSLCKYYQFIPIIYIGMLIWRNELYSKYHELAIKIIMKIFLVWVGLQINYPLLLCVLSEFGYYIIVNKVMINIYKFTLKKIRKMIKWIIYLNKDELDFYVMSTFMSVAIRYWYSYETTVKLTIIMLFLLYSCKQYKRFVFFITLFCSTLLSDFNTLHIMCNSIIVLSVMPMINTNAIKVKCINYYNRLYRYIKLQRVVVIDDWMDKSQIVTHQDSSLNIIDDYIK
jgi:hypothetical protein